MDLTTQLIIAGGLILALIVFARVVNRKHKRKKKHK